MSEWQPIDTAPKDGTKILILSDWDRVIVVGEWKCEISDWIVSWDFEPFSKGYEATHWLSIPEIPK